MNISNINKGYSEFEILPLRSGNKKRLLTLNLVFACPSKTLCQYSLVSSLELQELNRKILRLKTVTLSNTKVTLIT